MVYSDYIKDLEKNSKLEGSIVRESKDGEWDKVTVYTDQGPVSRTVYNVANSDLASKVVYEGVCNRDVELYTYPESFAKLTFEKSGDGQSDKIYGTVFDAFENREVSFSSVNGQVEDNGALDSFNAISSNFRVGLAVLSRESDQTATEAELDVVSEQ